MELKIDIFFVLIFWIWSNLQGVESEEIGCFVNGECTQSPYVQEWPVVDAQECLEECQGFDGCEYFTYYGLDQDYCVGFSACVELNPASCQDCYSGNSSCPDLQCWVKGTCYGVFISVEDVASDSECLELCKTDKSCTWFTYNDADGACTLLEGCDDFSADDCDTCWSGQRQCGERRDMTKILLVAGWNNEEGGLDDVEVFDLASEVQACLSPSNYPFLAYYTVGTMLSGVPVVCGGWDDERVIETNACYQYNSADNIWAPASQNMIVSRYAHLASMVDSATWLISGGLTEAGTISLDSTEVYRDGSVINGPTLPSARYLHCQVTVNSSHIAILGGSNGENYLYDFYLLEWESQDWIRMPDLPFLLHSDPCGLIENSVNGQELVVLEDYAHCHIFNFRDQLWRDNGPQITDGSTLMHEEIVAQMETNFYIFGGRLEDGNTSTAVYEFDAENYAWVKQSFILPKPWDAGVAIPVPDDIVNCP